ncbi:helix-turn-helix transcriptional regulator [Methanoregula sp.]|uniref:helix-turn-helix transcriptional regulator n=1 Tax=Methanoregula sp. TaxID=2052170 RepID=UPI002B6AA920|nr:MarR family transcriptional regulator [Methanoregula sp.]HVP96950.1 MarR family transcriptional regulator [Methanoregula sp.]
MDMLKRYVAITVLLFLCIMPLAMAASTTDYATTYTITLQPDGSAVWAVEYRTPLTTNDDLAGFQNYSADINNVYLPQLEDLMQHSSSEAALATTRPMSVSNFSGSAVVQTSPTGQFGVVTYTFTWTNFSVPEGGLVTGDSFAGGLYLDKDSALVIRYPSSYSVTSANPAPDQQSGNSLTWYGEREFDAGEPHVVLAGPSFPLLPVVIVIAVAIIAGAGVAVYRRKQSVQTAPEDDPDDPAGPGDQPTPLLTGADLASLKDRILSLLKAHGGERFQSDIVRDLGLPKSTVSSTLNELHQQGIIVKIKKGRENLIRLTGEKEDSQTDPGTSSR